MRDGRQMIMQAALSCCETLHKVELQAAVPIGRGGQAQQSKCTALLV